jgi:hypothetical protein
MSMITIQQKLIAIISCLLVLAPLELGPQTQAQGQTYTQTQAQLLTWVEFLPMWMNSKTQDQSRFEIDQERHRLLNDTVPRSKVSLSVPLAFRMSGLVRSHNHSTPMNSADSVDSTDTIDETHQRGSNNPNRSFLWGISGGVGVVVDSLGISGSVGAGIEATLFHVPQAAHQELQFVPQLFSSLIIPTNLQQSRLIQQLNHVDLSLLDTQSRELVLNQQIQGLNWYTQMGILLNQLWWVERIIPLVEGLAKLQEEAILSGNVTPWESFELKKELLSLHHQRSLLEQELEKMAGYMEVNLLYHISLERFPIHPPSVLFPTPSGKQQKASQKDLSERSSQTDHTHFANRTIAPKTQSGIEQISMDQWDLERQRLEISHKVLRAQESPKILVSLQAQIQQGQISWNGSVGFQPRKVFGQEKLGLKNKTQELERLRLDQEKKDREIEWERMQLEVALTGQVQWMESVELWISQFEGLFYQFARAKESRVIDELAYSQGRLEMYQFQAAFDKARWEVWRLEMIKGIMGWD